MEKGGSDLKSVFANSVKIQVRLVNSNILKLKLF